MSNTSRRTVLAGAGALAATGASAQTPPPAAPAPARPSVVLDTDLGPITIELATDKAPITCANFLRYVDAKRLKSFYRAMKARAAPPEGLIQGGADPDKLFPPIELESTMKTGLSHHPGAVSMARTTPNSAQGAFFICIGDLSYAYDANPFEKGDNQGFAVFGKVTSGMDVATAILNAPISPTKGADWGMKGQILDPEIKIRTAKRV